MEPGSKPAIDLSQFKALSFDCYGTLIDWESGIAAVLAPWASEQGLDLSREELLTAYARSEALVERETPSALYPEVLASAMRRTGEELGRSVSSDWARRLGESVPDCLMVRILTPACSAASCGVSRTGWPLVGWIMCRWAGRRGRAGLATGLAPRNRVPNLCPARRRLHC